ENGEAPIHESRDDEAHAGAANAGLAPNGEAAREGAEPAEAERFARSARPSARPSAALSQPPPPSVRPARPSSLPPVPPSLLDDVPAFADLPDDARDRLRAHAEVEILAADEEIPLVGLALVMEGSGAVQAAVAESTAARIKAGDIVYGKG